MGDGDSPAMDLFLFLAEFDDIACVKFLIACYGNGVLVHGNVDYLLCT